MEISTENDILKLALADISVEEVNGITNELIQGDIIQIEEMKLRPRGAMLLHQLHSINRLKLFLEQLFMTIATSGVPISLS
ncbi:hypothetical protein ACQKL5_13100 [Peribacillus sp. NPDC097675]|uniref:hypothetical protein n=1 Tax=Peribacillus sp. NPDC097675 TaxID=3390618 RepID=UPI003D0106F0